ncbi:hypothetical protein Droror1_Dr00011262 [Drosera rotundifolia]
MGLLYSSIYTVQCFPALPGCWLHFANLNTPKSADSNQFKLCLSSLPPHFRICTATEVVSSRSHLFPPFILFLLCQFFWVLCNLGLRRPNQTVICDQSLQWESRNGRIMVGGRGGVVVAGVGEGGRGKGGRGRGRGRRWRVRGRDGGVREREWRDDDRVRGRDDEDGESEDDLGWLDGPDNDVEAEKFEQKVGPEVMSKLNETFDELEHRLFPHEEENYLDAIDMNLKIELEPEYMVEFENNPDIDEKPPISLEDALEKMKPFLMAYEGIENLKEWEWVC